ncbi:MAG: hypothetical protein AAFV80_19140, partial [Bacteroidota bacterium]
MSWTKRLTPGFLKKLDHWLLVNHPVIWRTRIHFVGFWSFVVTNLLIWATTTMVPVSPKYFASHDTIAIANLVSWVLIFFAAIYWGVISAKFQFKSTKLKHIFSTVMLVFLGFTSFFSNQLLLSHQLKLTGYRAIGLNELLSDQAEYYRLTRISRLGTIEHLPDLSEEKAAMAAVIDKYGIPAFKIQERNRYNGLNDGYQNEAGEREFDRYVQCLDFEYRSDDLVKSKYYG